MRLWAPQGMPRMPQQETWRHNTAKWGNWGRRSRNAIKLPLRDLAETPGLAELIPPSEGGSDQTGLCYLHFVYQDGDTGQQKMAWFGEKRYFSAFPGSLTLTQSTEREGKLETLKQAHPAAHSIPPQVPHSWRAGVCLQICPYLPLTAKPGMLCCFLLQPGIGSFLEEVIGMAIGTARGAVLQASYMPQCRLNAAFRATRPFFGLILQCSSSKLQFF